jgi:hypothetical protein
MTVGGVAVKQPHPPNWGITYSISYTITYPLEEFHNPTGIQERPRGHSSRIRNGLVWVGDGATGIPDPRPLSGMGLDPSPSNIDGQNGTGMGLVVEGRGTKSCPIDWLLPPEVISAVRTFLGPGRNIPMDPGLAGAWITWLCVSGKLMHHMVLRQSSRGTILMDAGVADAWITSPPEVRQSQASH